MKRKNILGWLLVLCGAVSLIFGWPWGSLVGALLVLAGVLTLKLKLEQPQAQPTPRAPILEQSALLIPAPKDNSFAEAERLMGIIKDLVNRGEPVPDELTDRAKQLAAAARDKWFSDYDALISNGWTKVVDLSAVAQEVRSKHGWPARGSILGHPAASEPLDSFLMRIETLGGKVPLPEAIFMQAVLEQGDGPEARYLKERQKRGYPSLYANHPQIEWAAKPGFYERQLQRRHNNVLFPADKRRVSQQDLYIARQLDEEERLDFLEQWKRFLEKLVGGAGIVPASEATDLLHDLYDLLERAALIGGETTTQVEQVHEAYQALLAQLYDSFKDNPQATETLKSAEHSRWKGSAFLLDPRFRQVFRIADEADMVPAVLSEGEETVRAVVDTLDAATLRTVRDRVLQLINESPEAREVLRPQRSKLEALGIEG